MQQFLLQGRPPSYRLPDEDPMELALQGSTGDSLNVSLPHALKTTSLSSTNIDLLRHL